jgi:hypothetical protein
VKNLGCLACWGVVTAGQDSPEATEIENAVASLVNDWAAVLFGEDDITLLEAKSGGETPFKPSVEYWDRGIASIWRGADLSDD